MSYRDLRVVVGGYLGLLPAGGVAWDYVQYPRSFADLGCDVFYVEDTRLWPVYASDDQTDAAPNARYLGGVMEAFGMGDRWAYRDEASGRLFGMSEAALAEVYRTADVFVNVSCSTAVRDETARIPVRVLVDSDPMFTQIQLETGAHFTDGGGGLRALVDAHTHHVTFGEAVGGPDCRMPAAGVAWTPTRQPVCLDRWRPQPPRPGGAWTTLMNWSAAPPLRYAGETWGQKDVAFRQVEGLPARVPGVPLALAVGQTTGAPFPRAQAEGHGWAVLDPDAVAPDWRQYRAFLEGSRGEFSVAKETYVKGRTGWFSCRSACYLAAGRPVVTEDTGWSAVLPHGLGLLPFSDAASAAEAVRAVEADHAAHARAARELAEAHFDGRRVLADLLASAGV